MAKVYLVTSGSYSDYGVEAVCSTRKKAERLRVILASHNAIEEFIVDSSLAKYPPGKLFWCIEIFMVSGTIRCVSQVNPACELFKDTIRLSDLLLSIMYVWAKDKDHAIKVATDRRRKLLATGGGSTSRKG